MLRCEGREQRGTRARQTLHLPRRHGLQLAAGRHGAQHVRGELQQQARARRRHRRRSSDGRLRADAAHDIPHHVPAAHGRRSVGVPQALLGVRQAAQRADQPAGRRRPAAARQAGDEPLRQGLCREAARPAAGLPAARDRPPAGLVQLGALRLPQLARGGALRRRRSLQGPADAAVPAGRHGRSAEGRRQDDGGAADTDAE
eukprot:5383219-Prymnesium_polylepis.1